MPGLVGPAGLDDAFVADEKNLRGADTGSAFADLAQGAAAKDDFWGYEFADIHGVSL
jgi:hypothetical protein